MAEKRRYRMIHDEVLVRYLMETYPWGTWATNVRVGKPREELIPPGITVNMKRWFWNLEAIADAIVFLPEEIHIIETLVRPEWWKLEQLDQYEELFKMTEEFKEHWHKPIKKILLVTVVNPWLEKRAEARGIKVIKYTTYEAEMYKRTLPVRKQFPRFGGLTT